MIVKSVEFSKLGAAIVVVKEFIYTETNIKNVNLNTRLLADLGLYGDDNLELIENFVKRFELNYSDFNYSNHFHSESELFQGAGSVFWLFKRLLTTILKLFPSKVHQHKKIEENKKLDLTLKDMVIWYLEGEFKSRGSIKFVIDRP